MPNCPRCGSSHVIKNGHIHKGKAKFACKDCRRQFVEHPAWEPISAETKALIDNLLLERLSLAGIVRATGVSARRLQYYVNAKYAAVPQVADVPVKKGRLTVQADELWSFVGNKANPVWLWWAIDAQTRLVVGCAIGPRDKQPAEDWWFSLPPEYRQRAICFTDFFQLYASVLPSKRHKAVDKASGKTSLIQRLNNTIRQRCSRLVRKALSFSKKLANHIGAIWYFIHAYNRQRLAQLGLATMPA